MKPKPLRSLLAALLFSVGFLGKDASAGVTGVAGINDYTITAACLPGSTSCTPCTLTSGTTVNLTVSTVPNTPVVFVITLCPCVPDNFFLPPVACLIPPTSFFGASNQSIDIGLTCPLITCTAISNAAGFATCSIALPLMTAPVTIATQAAVVGLPCGFPSTFVMTQAYSVTINP